MNTVISEIQTITLDPAKTNAILASYRQGNFHWHIDGATDELPQKATLLTAREVDPAGGDTEFANIYAAYDALSEAERTEIADLQVDHNFARAQGLANPGAPTNSALVGTACLPASSHGVDSPDRSDACARCDRRPRLSAGPQIKGERRLLDRSTRLVDSTAVHAAPLVAQG